MQRINYENLSQAPLLSSGVGCPPLLPAERVYSHLVGGSWEVRRVGDARADPKSRNMQDQATPMKLRTLRQNPRLDLPRASFSVSCRWSALYLFFKQ